MSKIVALSVNNVMRIHAVHIEPTGNVVVIGGRNAQGKTSVLEAIAMAIGGLRLCPPEPIRAGQDEAEIELQLGELKITRKFWLKDGKVESSLVVRNAKEEPLKAPQGVLNQLVGSLAFDPLEFARMQPGERAKTLRELVGLDVEQLEDEQQRVFDRRTEKGREKRAAHAVVVDMPFWETAGVTETSVVEIGERMAAAVSAEAQRQELIGQRDRGKQELDRIDAALKDIEANAKRLRDSVPGVETGIKRAEQFLMALESPDVDAINAELAGVEEANSRVRANLARAVKVEDEEAVAAEWKTLDTRHVQITAEILQRTQAVSYPIDELELRKGGVYYQGHPFEQASRAERIKVSLAMGCALNENLRVLLIRDGSVLDDESMQLIAELAEARDFQFWIEMARGYEGSAEPIIIEDGQVLLAERKESPAAEMEDDDG